MRYRINSPEVINETIDGEAVMINLSTGSYYSLDAHGADVWTGIELGVPVDDLIGELAGTYDAHPDQIAADVTSLLAELVAENLIVATSDADGTPRATEGGGVPSRGAWQSPRLERFTDMQDLILLDPVHEVDPRGWPHPLADEPADPDH